MIDKNNLISNCEEKVTRIKYMTDIANKHGFDGLTKTIVNSLSKNPKLKKSDLEQAKYEIEDFSKSDTTNLLYFYENISEVIKKSDYYYINGESCDFNTIFGGLDKNSNSIVDVNTLFKDKFIIDKLPNKYMCFEYDVNDLEYKLFIICEQLDEYVEVYTIVKRFIDAVNKFDYTINEIHTIIKLDGKEMDYKQVIENSRFNFTDIKDGYLSSGQNILSVIYSGVHENVKDYLLTTQLILNTTLKLLECKNVKFKENEYKPRREWWKKNRKRTFVKPFTYKTIYLIPITKKQLEMEKKGLWDYAINYNKGRFRVYTKDKPLFGKHSGTFWWQQKLERKSE